MRLSPQRGESYLRLCSRVRQAKLTASFVRCSVASLVMVGLLGCEPPPRPPLVKKKAQNDRLMQLPAENEFQEVTADVGDLPLRFAAEAPFELWEAHFLGGEQIGFAHLQAELTDKSNEVRYRYNERLQILRGEQLFDSELSQTSIETAQGRLKQFDAVLLNNSQRTFTSGVVQGAKLSITTRREGEDETQSEVSWSAKTGGLLAVQQHLREKPMERGDKRELTVLAPVIYQPSKIQLEAIGMASVSMLSGESKMLLEIEVTPYIQNTEAPKTTLWTDETGNILKQYIPTYGLIIVRTDKETATQHFAPERDVLESFQIPLAKRIETPADLKKASFTLKSKSGRDLSSVLKEQPGQLVREVQDGQIQIAVVRDTDVAQGTIEPTDGDRRPGPLVQSGDPLVKAIASVAPPETKAVLARKLARTVYDHIEQKNNSEAFASAAFVASTGRGDCTEHAVLLAALCRARGIPARVASGLVYVDSETGPAMRYHMWTLAFADEKWIHLDATLPSGLAPADRILIASDNLAGGNEYAVVQAVTSLVGDLEIELENSVLESSDPALNAAGVLDSPDKPATDPKEPAPEKPKNTAEELQQLLQGIDADGGN